MCRSHLPSCSPRLLAHPYASSGMRLQGMAHMCRASLELMGTLLGRPPTSLLVRCLREDETTKSAGRLQSMRDTVLCLCVTQPRPN